MLEDLTTEFNVKRNNILAEEFCQDLLAPVVEAYHDEKARLLAEGG